MNRPLYFFYVHDHLYRPAALLYINGAVTERYEYDVYGNPYILEPNFADDPDGKSDYGNPYYLRGKRLDLQDNGGLEFMSWPYRDYCTYLGRWLEQEKLGMVPNDHPSRNPFDVSKQCADGPNLYGFLNSNPVMSQDVYGLLIACCKISRTTTHTTCWSLGGARFTGPCIPVTCSTTTCTQVTMHTECSNPKTACCTYNKKNPNVEVYAAESEKCKWRDVYLGNTPIPVVADSFVYVKCDNWDFTVETSGLQGQVLQCYI